MYSVRRTASLTIRFDRLICDGVIKDQKDPARLGHVSRAQVSQIMALLYLVPDIQEAVLFMPRVERGRDPVKLRDLLPVAAEVEWRKQRRLWQEIWN